MASRPSRVASRHADQLRREGPLHAVRRDIQQNSTAFATRRHSGQLIASPPLRRRCATWHPAAVRFPALTRATCSRSRSRTAPAAICCQRTRGRHGSPRLMSKSGFDAVAGRYGDLAPRLFARSTGRSSDPPVNWTSTELHTCLAGNSDAHSPPTPWREPITFATGRLLLDDPRSAASHSRSGQLAGRLSLPTGPRAIVRPERPDLLIWSSCRR